MDKTIYTAYVPETDMTFILEDILRIDGEVASTEVKGFYFGEPNDEATKEFYGKIKAVFE